MWPVSQKNFLDCEKLCMYFWIGTEKWVKVGLAEWKEVSLVKLAAVQRLLKLFKMLATLVI